MTKREKKGHLWCTPRPCGREPARLRWCRPARPARGRTWPAAGPPDARMRSRQRPAGAGRPLLLLPLISLLLILLYILFLFLLLEI